MCCVHTHAGVYKHAQMSVRVFTCVRVHACTSACVCPCKRKVGQVWEVGGIWVIPFFSVAQRLGTVPWHRSEQEEAGDGIGHLWGGVTGRA